MIRFMGKGSLSCNTSFRSTLKSAQLQKPQATVSGDAVAYGSGLNDSINRPLAAGDLSARTGG